MTSTDKKVRILCVEDDPQMSTFLLAQLKARGFQVQAVRDGAQAIDLAAIFQPQLVLLDLSLPTLDGLTFLRRKRTMPLRFSRGWVTRVALAARLAALPSRTPPFPSS